MPATIFTTSAVFAQMDQFRLVENLQNMTSLQMFIGMDPLEREKTYRIVNQHAQLDWG